MRRPLVAAAALVARVLVCPLRLAARDDARRAPHRGRLHRGRPAARGRRDARRAALGSTVFRDDGAAPRPGSARAAPCAASSPIAARARSVGSTSPTRSSPTEWWRAAIGVDTLTPPRPASRSRSSTRASTHPSRVPRPAGHGDAQPAGARPDRRRARHGGRLARRRAGQRRRHRRHLSGGAAALVGRRQGAGHASSTRAEIVQGHPRRCRRRPGRDQPQPRHPTRRRS